MNSAPAPRAAARARPATPHRPTRVCVPGLHRQKTKLAFAEASLFAGGCVWGRGEFSVRDGTPVRPEPPQTTRHHIFISSTGELEHLCCTGTAQTRQTKGGREGSPRAMRGRAGERERLSGRSGDPPLAPKPVRSFPRSWKAGDAMEAPGCPLSRSRSSVDLSADRLYRLPAEGDLPDAAAWELAEGDCTSRIALRRGVRRGVAPADERDRGGSNEAAPNCASREGGGGKMRDARGGAGPPRTGSGSLGRPHPQRTSRAGVISRFPGRHGATFLRATGLSGPGGLRGGGGDDGPGNWPRGVLERW